MAFKNEYVPPLDQKTSDFLQDVRVILCKGHLSNNALSVDRKNMLILARTGQEHEIDYHDEGIGNSSMEMSVMFYHQVTGSQIETEPPKKYAVIRDILRHPIICNASTLCCGTAN